LTTSRPLAARPLVGVIGGTGDLGGGLAWRLVRAGWPVFIGSRDAPRGREAAAALVAEHPGAAVRGGDNLEAAGAAEIVLVTVPFAHQRATLESIAPAVQGKIVVDTTVPLQPPKVARVQLPSEGSAALVARDALGDGVRLVTACHNVGAEHLRSDHAIDCDVLVFGDDVAARDQTIELLAAAGLAGWHAGPLVNSVAAEALTSVLIGINKRYGIVGAGIRVTGTPTKGAPGTRGG
jgi:NADPH-dependent F420 reductase